MKVNNLTKIAIFSVITAVLSQISINVGFVPFSLGTFAVYLSAVFLNPKDAFLSQIVYLLLGILGLPVFSGFGLGIGHLMGYTGGFAISYPFVAVISSFFIHKYENKIIIFVGFCFATLVCYIFGISWFCYTSGMEFIKALYVVCFPFIIPDLIKIFISITAVGKLKSKVVY
ncbi:MAG: biotin transporter BioY [Bacilli bacterium]